MALYDRLGTTLTFKITDIYGPLRQIELSCGCYTICRKVLCTIWLSPLHCFRYWVCGYSYALCRFSVWSYNYACSGAQCAATKASRWTTLGATSATSTSTTRTTSSAPCATRASRDMPTIGSTWNLSTAWQASRWVLVSIPLFFSKINSVHATTQIWFR